MTDTSTDTLDALIARHVAGVLPKPARILVETHLALKPRSRRFADGLEALAGMALDDVAPLPLENQAAHLDRVLSGDAPIIRPARPSGDALFPAVLRDFIGFDADSVPWKSKLPGFKEYSLGEVDGCETNLYWLRPGRKIPEHTHEGTELFLVLDGDFHDAFGRYGRGDISIADESVDHQPIAGKDRPCIGFSVTDGALRMTGPLHRRLGDILGI